MTVTPSISGKQTTFIVFDLTNRLVNWSTSSNSDAGTYTIKITGKISALQTFTKDLQFILTVIASCGASTETISIIASIPPSDQTYDVTGPFGSVTIAPFIVSSTYCSSTDTVYSMSVTPTASFITFNSDTRVLSWTTADQTVVGFTYTIKITGTITAAALWTAFNQFTLTIKDQCDYQMGYIIRAPADQTISYIQGQTQLTVKLDSFTENDPYCTESNIIKSMSVTPMTTGQSFSFIQFDETNNLVSLYTNSQADAGIFTLTITGSIQGVNYKPSASTLITLTVLSKNCQTTTEKITIIPSQQPQNQTTYITKIGQLYIEDFTENSEFCTSQDIVYKMIVTSEKQDTSFINFNLTTRLVSWLSQSNDDVGNYTIEIQASIKSSMESISFNLEVKLQSQEYFPPMFSGLSSNTITIFLSEIAQNDTYNFGYILTSNSNSTVSLTYLISPEIGFTFFSIDPQTAVLQVTDRNGLFSYPVSIYLIQIYLQDNENKTSNSDYLITFDVQNQHNQIKISNNQSSQRNQTVTSSYNVNLTESTTESPYWKFMTTTNDGQIKIQFSENLKIPANFSVRVNSSVLSLKLISQTVDQKKYQGFYWNLTEFTEQSMTMQVVFYNPLYISSIGLKRLDLIEVTCLNNSYFVSVKSSVLIKKDSAIRKTVPPQLLTKKNSKIEKLQEVLQDGTKGFVIGTFITNLFLSVSLTKLWNMLNSLQIIDGMTDLNTLVPANVLDFYNFLKTLAKFKFIPSDSIFEGIGIGSDKFQQFADLQTKFEALGPLFLVLLSSCVIFVLLLLISLLKKTFGFIHNSPMFNKIYIRINRYLFWNSTLRFLMEGYIGLALSSLSIAYQGYDWSDEINRAQAVFSIFSVVLCAISPMIMTFFFSRRIKMFQQKQFLDRFGSVIGDLNGKLKLSTCFISMFCYRRLALCALILFMVPYPCAQVQLLSLKCKLSIIIFGYINPYTSSGLRKQEFFNEATIMLCAYHYFLFTDFVDDPELRYKLGFSLISTTGFNIVVNFAILLHSTLLSIGKRLRQLYQRFKICRQQRSLRKKRIDTQKQRKLNNQTEIMQKQEIDCLEQKKELKREDLQAISEAQSEQESDRIQEHKRVKKQQQIYSPHASEQIENGIQQTELKPLPIVERRIIVPENSERLTEIYMDVLKTGMEIQQLRMQLAEKKK